MAASVNFSPGRVKVRGGKKIDEFIRQALTGDYLRQIIAEFIKQFPIQALRAASPRRTGKLAESLRLVQRGYVVELQGEFYGVFHKQIEAEFLRLASETLRRIL